MSFAGHVLDMIKRIEANRALMHAHKDKAAKLRSLYYGSNSDKRQTNEKPIPAEKLAAIKQEIRAKARREQRKQRIIAWILILLAAGISAYLIHVYLSDTPSNFPWGEFEIDGNNKLRRCA